MLDNDHGDIAKYALQVFFLFKGCQHEKILIVWPAFIEAPIR